MPISRSQMPRQMYGLGSFVKSIGKGIKKIVKSPIGKAAILGFGANALMPGGLSSLFGSGSFNPLLRKTLGGDFAQSQFGSLLSGAKNFLGSNVGKFVAGATAGKLFGGMEPQQIEELQSDPEALANYLRQYYSNLNQEAKPEEIEEFVQRNMKAGGGRMGYDDGTNPKKDFLVKKGYGDMVKNMSVIEIDQLFNSVKGTTTAANTYREPAYMGGRMGYAMGTDQIVDQASGIMGLPQNINKAGVKELDLRESGGFIPPVGIKEKADDIPAMLSNNEFVFTADAVRGMGDGNVNKGAQRMYDMMKKLEKGGRV